MNMMGVRAAKNTVNFYDWSEVYGRSMKLRPRRTTTRILFRGKGRTDQSPVCQTKANGAPRMIANSSRSDSTSTWTCPRAIGYAGRLSTLSAIQ